MKARAIGLPTLLPGALILATVAMSTAAECRRPWLRSTATHTPQRI
jgi:hypothetical protein